MNKETRERIIKEKGNTYFSVFSRIGLSAIDNMKFEYMNKEEFDFMLDDLIRTEQNQKQIDSETKRNILSFCEPRLKEIEYKQCSVCKKIRSIDMYSKSCKTWDNHQFKCKECTKDYMRDYNHRPYVKKRKTELKRKYGQKPHYKQKYREYMQTYLQKERGKKIKILTGYRYILRHTHNIEDDDLVELSALLRYKNRPGRKYNLASAIEEAQKIMKDRLLYEQTLSDLR